MADNTHHREIRDILKGMEYIELAAGSFLAVSGCYAMTQFPGLMQNAALTACIGFGIILVAFGTHVHGAYRGWTVLGAGFLELAEDVTYQLHCDEKNQDYTLVDGQDGETVGKHDPSCKEPTDSLAEHFYLRSRPRRHWQWATASIVVSLRSSRLGSRAVTLPIRYAINLAMKLMRYPNCPTQPNSEVIDFRRKAAETLPGLIMCH